MELINKLIILFKSIFSISTKLNKPIEEFDYNSNKQDNSLLGICYEQDIDYRGKIAKIRSPISGLIKNIYPNNSILIVNRFGLNVLVKINCKKTIEIENKENEKIERTIATVEDDLIKLSVIIPWQYNLIRKITNGNIFYNSPFCESKIMNVYDYYDSLRGYKKEKNNG